MVSHLWDFAKADMCQESVATIISAHNEYLEAEHSAAQHMLHMQACSNGLEARLQEIDWSWLPGKSLAQEEVSGRRGNEYQQGQSATGIQFIQLIQVVQME